MGGMNNRFGWIMKDEVLTAGRSRNCFEVCPFAFAFAFAFAFYS